MTECISNFETICSTYSSLIRNTTHYTPPAAVKTVYKEGRCISLFRNNFLPMFTGFRGDKEKEPAGVDKSFIQVSNEMAQDVSLSVLFRGARQEHVAGVRIGCGSKVLSLQCHVRAWTLAGQRNVNAKVGAILAFDVRHKYEREPNSMGGLHTFPSSVQQHSIRL